MKNIYRNCCHCNIEFLVPSNNRTKKFCTQSCGTINQNKVQNQQKLEKYSLEPSYCIKCGTKLEFEHRTNKFCSISCSSAGNKNRITHGKYAKKECNTCGIITNGKFCSKKCSGISKRKYKTEEEKISARKRMQRESYARYAARKKYQTPVDEDLSAIKKFYRNCADGYEVDHIIPISKGGAHSISNLQYLTISENRKKSNKIVEPPGRFELP